MDITNDPNIRTFEETPKKRAEITAGLRALAQFLEDNPTVPCPDMVHGQYSYSEPLDMRTMRRVPVADDVKIKVVRDAAAALGADDLVEVDADSATLRYVVYPHTRYVVHARLGSEQ